MVDVLSIIMVEVLSIIMVEVLSIIMVEELSIISEVLIPQSELPHPESMEELSLD
jgi:hypothetical protein